MIQSKSDIAIASHGIEKEGFFRISQNNISHILGILRDSMYSDKIGAVCREYMCNAYDSHVLVGKENTPISVSLPTALYPFFTVRDYGQGLTEEEIFELFTSYGESTKRESNDFTGMLGIGSKSAFAYTDSFNVVSYQHGKKSTYTCFIDETEVGKVTRLSVEDCAEDDSGLEINVPVNRSDFKSFSDKVREVSEMFLTLPEVDGAVIGGFPAVDVKTAKNFPFLLDRSGRLFLTGNRTHYDSGVSVVMGNVGYKIPRGELPFSLDSFFFNGYHYGYSSPTLCIRVPIGSVDVAASRENLSFNKRTKENLRAIFEEARVWITESCKQFLLGAPSEIAARSLLALYESRGILKPTDSVVWGEQKIDLRKTSSKDLAIFSSRDPLVREDFQKVLKSYRSGNVRISGDSVDFNPRSVTTPESFDGVIINDLGTNRYRKFLAEAMEDEHYYSNWLICTRPKNVEEVKKAFGGCYKLLSSFLEGGADIAKIAAEKVAPKFSPKQSLFKYNFDKGEWEEEDTDLDESSGYFVPIHRFLPVLNDDPVGWVPKAKAMAPEAKPSDRDLKVLTQLVDWAKKVGMDVPVLYGVRYTSLGCMEGRDNWKPFFTTLEKCLDKYFREHEGYKYFCSAAHNPTPLESSWSYGYTWNHTRDNYLQNLAEVKSNLFLTLRHKFEEAGQYPLVEAKFVITFFNLLQEEKDKELGDLVYNWVREIVDSLELPQPKSPSGYLWYWHPGAVFQHLEVLDVFAQYKEKMEALVLQKGE